uniref:Uncharacterized protein n=1 Tax=Schistosoma curassoni TaxID=6186 RepID=A0A183KVG8_9TREM
MKTVSKYILMTVMPIECGVKMKTSNAAKIIYSFLEQKRCINIYMILYEFIQSVFLRVFKICSDIDITANHEIYCPKRQIDTNFNRTTLKLS